MAKAFVHPIDVDEALPNPSLNSSDFDLQDTSYANQYHETYLAMQDGVEQCTPPLPLYFDTQSLV